MHFSLSLSIHLSLHMLTHAHNQPLFSHVFLSLTHIHDSFYSEHSPLQLVSIVTSFDSVVTLQNKNKNNIFSLLVKSSLVKLETSCTVILFSQRRVFSGFYLTYLSSSLSLPLCLNCTLTHRNGFSRPKPIFCFLIFFTLMKLFFQNFVI